MKTFIKKMNRLTKEQIVLLVNKYDVFSELFVGSDLHTPKVVTYSNSAITFYQLGLGTSLVNSSDRGQFRKAGEVLKELHLVRKKQIGTDFIHGDYWAGNIFFDKNQITVLDFEPPKSCADFEYYYKNNYHIDIAIFIYQVFSNKMQVGTRRKKIALVVDFLDGYGRDILSGHALFGAMWVEHRRYICSMHKRHMRITTSVWSAILGMYVFFVMLYIWKR